MNGISRIIDMEHILLDLEAGGMTACLHRLAEHLVRVHDIDEQTERNLEKALMEREKLGGTCLGNGIAVPHAYFSGMPAAVVVIGRLREPVDFGAPDARPVDIVVLLAGPPEAQKDHIKLLARIARLFHDPEWVEDLRAAKEASEVMAAVKAVEDRHC